jgi:hypothetical protein
MTRNYVGGAKPFTSLSYIYKYKRVALYTMKKKKVIVFRQFSIQNNSPPPQVLGGSGHCRALMIRNLIQMSFSYSFYRVESVGVKKEEFISIEVSITDILLEITHL